MNDPAKILGDAAERVRDVNYTAAHRSAYRFPSEAYHAYGAMVQVAERLAQAIHQHAGWIAQETDCGGVAVVSGEYVDDPAAAAAAGALLTAAHELHAAHNIASALASARNFDDEEVGR